MLKPLGYSFVFLFLSSHAAFAGSYRCALKEIYSLSEDGRWDRHPLGKILISEEIIVDRENGKVFHSQFGNISYSNRVVLDPGSSHSSLKVIAYSDLGLARVEGEAPFRNLTVMQIHTYVDNSRKPFVVLTSGSMGSGTCQ